MTIESGVLLHVAQIQREKIETLECRIARTVGLLTYHIEKNSRVSLDAVKQARDILKGNS